MYKLIIAVLLLTPVYGYSINKYDLNELLSSSLVAEVRGYSVVEIEDKKTLRKEFINHYGGETLHLNTYTFYPKNMKLTETEYWNKYHNYSGINSNERAELFLFYDNNQNIKKILIRSRVNSFQNDIHNYKGPFEVISIEPIYTKGSLTSLNFMRFWDKDGYKKESTTAVVMKLYWAETQSLANKMHYLSKELQRLNVSVKAPSVVDLSTYTPLEKKTLNPSSFLRNQESLKVLDKILSFIDLANTYNNEAKSLDYLSHKKEYLSDNRYKAKYHISNSLRVFLLTAIAGVDVAAGAYYINNPNWLSGFVFSVLLYKTFKDSIHLSSLNIPTKIKGRPDLKSLENSIKRVFYSYKHIFKFAIMWDQHLRFKVNDDRPPKLKDHPSPPMRPLRIYKKFACRRLFI